MQRFSLSPNVTMAATVQDDDDDLGTFLAYSPTTASLARNFGYVPPTLRLPSPSPSSSPLAVTPPQLRNISSAGVGLAPNPPQPPPRRVAPYKGTPPTGPLLSSSPWHRPTVRHGSVMDHPLPSVRRVWVYLRHHLYPPLCNIWGSRRVMQHPPRNPLEPQEWVYPLQPSLHPLHRLQHLVVARPSEDNAEEELRGSPVVPQPVQLVHAWHAFATHPSPADAFNRFNVQPMMPFEDGRLPP